MEADNTKAMREALAAINCIDTRGLKRLLYELVEADIPDGGQINKTIFAIEKARRALAEPPRNCDLFADWDAAFAAYCEVNDGPHDDRWFAAMCEWLFEKAKGV